MSDHVSTMTNAGPLFIDSRDAKRIRERITETYEDFVMATRSGRRFEARGIAILGSTGTGKSEGTMQALEALGMAETNAGDPERPFLKLDLGARATLKSLSAALLEELGWPARQKDSAEALLRSSRNYMAKLNTKILVIDEIQHIRSTGKQDREDLQDFLKSLVKPRVGQIIPILIGMPEFNDVLASDGQLDRRYRKVRMSCFDPALDLARTIRVLKIVAENTGIALGASVMTQNFAARLMHAGMYAFGEICVWCQRAASKAYRSDADELVIAHFQDCYRQEEDCVPALNPFIADDFETIKIKPQE
ncbi:TniB family NTP-binding protein [Shimia sp. R9_3]|uniref:TniB family NTP-binding protein n=1 Tax=Shimia sp. R9_3 TaxID=2821113 RepID=UPI001ADBE9C3|nr:TniB family NTP-binding protein [Shimia sp. R9_3]MBO9400509.1 TniB family NTP-binding protein [Shimia sp. R9_3]